MDCRLKHSGMVNAILLIVFGMASLASVSCKGGHSSSSADENSRVIPLKYAENLKITEYDGYTEVSVRNPWDTLKILHRYVLVPKNRDVPKNLPKGDLIRTPIDNALIYSTVHSSLVTELGAIDAIKGVCGSQYINDEELKSRVISGKVVDCGSSQAPVIEQIIKLQPQIVMLSPFENNDKYAKVGELGIPIVECADYMETSPLARAEWVRFYGMLFGKEDAADKMFADTERNYNSLKEKASKVTDRPKVLMDQRYGQVWYVPGANSTTGKMIEDAGGTNPFSYLKQSGSVPLSPEKVLYEAHDADIWFVKYHQNNEKTMSEFANDASVNSQFKAYKEGKVYGCNTQYVDFYEETPYHPDYLLEDYISRIHPELNIGADASHYFQQMKQ